ncbi:MAG: PilZ domain-containing protein [Nitrospira sp.]|nr:PilZ domain-containing protein [Nitrospira sp.]
MRTYAVRKKLRTPVQCQFCYFNAGTLVNGIVWDLSDTGWRATGQSSLAVGTETTVYITLQNGSQSYNVLIDAAIVRWANGREAGWEIVRIDAANRARLTDFVEHFKLPDLTATATDRTHW